ncbi:hypothetical protein EDD80_12310 [Anseongella ginsenosidimutans]|uniref:Uncharacterized protein n=2 Tax=Anseongella ginsenosidimutans TaxID=496056 RepID=A0A4R3KKI3_9SPHI|nr:hypothetical protein EDD80_12310 [Anseongella ginsenosidimutans]
MKSKQKKPAQRRAAIRTAAVVVFVVALVLNVKVTLLGPFALSSEQVLAQVTGPDTGSKYDDTGFGDWCEDVCNADYEGDWEQCLDSSSSSGEGSVSGGSGPGGVTGSASGGGSNSETYDDRSEFNCHGGNYEECTPVACQ